MRCNGEWLQCDDGIVRPIIRADILAGDGTWRAAELLVDTGADRTVISANVLESLNLQFGEREERIGGIGGLVDSVTVATQIRFTRDDGEKVRLRGTYAGCADYEALDMSVLGRDILNMFAVIVDHGADVVAILGGQHHYTVHRR